MNCYITSDTSENSADANRHNGQAQMQRVADTPEWPSARTLKQAKRDVLRGARRFWERRGLAALGEKEVGL